MANGRLEDEYGVYERLAVLETEVEALKNGKPTNPLNSLNPITWILIAATALGNGPEVLQLMAKVLSNGH